MTEAFVCIGYEQYVRRVISPGFSLKLHCICIHSGVKLLFSSSDAFIVLNTRVR